MNQNKSAHIFVIGNEKGGAGKTTCSMHLIAGILDLGFDVVSIDTDSRQHSLTNYINNRKIYLEKNPSDPIKINNHYHINIDSNYPQEERDAKEKEAFENIIKNNQNQTDYIIIDTPGSHTFLSKLAHSYANTVITPINDSFLDIDVLAKINPDSLNIIEPSIYSQMIWEQKIQKVQRGERGPIDWVIMRNRLSNLDAINKRNVEKVLGQLSKRVSFKVIPGFSERVIFRELFLQGLTLLDLDKTNYVKSFSMSHVAARQELRDFLFALNINQHTILKTS